MPEGLPEIILMAGCISAGILIVFYSLKNGISPMPSSPGAVRAIISLVSDEKTDGRIMELGSGWGHVTAALARAFPSARVMGVENSLVPYGVACCLKWLWPRKNLHFRRADIFRVPLDEADVVVCYLFPGAMNRLKGKILRECGDGCRVVSHTFALAGWTAARQIRLGGLWNSRVYLYRVGENRANRDIRPGGPMKRPKPVV